MKSKLRGWESYLFHVSIYLVKGENRRWRVPLTSRFHVIGVVSICSFSRFVVLSFHFWIYSWKYGHQNGLDAWKLTSNPGAELRPQTTTTANGGIDKWSDPQMILVSTGTIQTIEAMFHWTRGASCSAQPSGGIPLENVARMCRNGNKPGGYLWTSTINSCNEHFKTSNNFRLARWIWQAPTEILLESVTEESSNRQIKRGWIFEHKYFFQIFPK